MADKLPLRFDIVRKRLFVQNLSLNLSPTDAAREAGFTSNLKRIASRLMEDEEVIEMLAKIQAEIDEKYDASREKVLQHLADAREMARDQGDVKAMVMAINPVIEVMGYKAPQQMEVRRIDIHGPRMREQIRSVSDGELLALAHEEGFESVDLLPVLDAEVEDVDEGK